MLAFSLASSRKMQINLNSVLSITNLSNITSGGPSKRYNAYIELMQIAVINVPFILRPRLLKNNSCLQSSPFAMAVDCFVLWFTMP